MTICGCAKHRCGEVTLTSSQRIDVIYALRRAADNAFCVAEKAPSSELITTVEQMLVLPHGTVLVDRYGSAWQVKTRGSTLHLATTRGGVLIPMDTATLMLPMRVVDDGRPELDTEPEPGRDAVD